MCGRVTLALDKQQVLDILKDVFQVNNQVTVDAPRYNIGPGQQVLSVVQTKKERRAGYLHWGYKPEWADKRISPLINARSESISEKPMFKESFIKRRCIIIGDSFYEWMENSKQMVYRFQPKEGLILPFAAVYTRLPSTDNSNKFGFAIVTQAANETMSGIHPRMPVLLTKKTLNHWLNPGFDSTSLIDIVTANQPDLSMYKVTDYVNSIHHDDKRCIIEDNSFL